MQIKKHETEKKIIFTGENIENSENDILRYILQREKNINEFLDYISNIFTDYENKMNDSTLSEKDKKQWVIRTTQELQIKDQEKIEQLNNQIINELNETIKVMEDAKKKLDEHIEQLSVYKK